MSTPAFISKWQAMAPQLLSLLRMVAAFIQVIFGTTKFLAFPAGIPPNGGTVPVMSQLWIGAILEIVGGTLLFLGLFTRPTAFVLSGTMAVAYFQFHFPQSFWPTINMGVDAVLFCFIWLYISAAGPGPWSLDARRTA
jgi:putative oxidoreductase